MNRLVASVGAAIAAVMVSAIVQAAPVSLAEGDAEGEHSFDTAGHWENTTAPEPGSDYLVALGDDAVLRTPIVNIKDEASEAFTEFAGDSLTIGTADTPGTFYDFFYRYARLRIPELHLVNGAFWSGTEQTYYEAKNEQALYGTIYIDSTTNNPFAFKGLKTGESGLSLRGPLVGNEDSAICVKGGKGTTMLALCASSPDFKGRIIVETNGKIWPGPQALAENAFGSTPETFMKDAIIFRNGGGLGSSNSTYWDLKAENRGFWVEGSAIFSSQGSYKISMPIGGGQLPEGKYLQIQPHSGAVITVNAPVSAYPIKLNNGRVLFTENATIEGETPILIAAGGYLGSTVDRSFKVDFQGTGFYYEAPMNATSVSVITLEEGSLWAETKNTCEIRISAAGFPMLGIDGWIPVLKVPTSVKDLSTVTFSCQGASGKISGALFKVETDEDGLQTVSVMPPTYYVVHPSTPGHEAVAPYTSWETAATNIADAVLEAADNGMGGRIYVDRGTYDITEPIPFAQRVSGSDRPVSLVGVNRETMERDAEHVILDGGYPARTNRIFNLSNSAGSSLVSLTMQHACNMGGDGNWNNGGVAYLHAASADFVVTGCRFIENHAARGGVFQASSQTITNCYFKGNTATTGPSCIHNPQGAASVDGNYLKVVDCLFEDNGNTAGGESIFTGGRNTRFYNCTFRRCGRNGAGLFGFSYYSVMQNCLFEDNYGSVGLGCSGNCPFVWSDLVIRNSSVGTSSALSLPNGPVERVTVVGCTCGKAISGNMANIRNFLVISNTCSDAAVHAQDGTAGKAHSWDSGTIVANTANCAISIAANGNNDGVTNIVRNCVAWGNRKTSGVASTIAVNPKHKVVSFTHCDTETPVPAAYDDGTCFSENPKFFNPFRTGDVRLRQDSPLIGAGLLQDWMEGAVDLAGNPRVVGEAPDIGCYERQGTEIDPPYPCTRAVAKEEDRTGVWTNAVVGLPEALKAAFDDETLYVKAGTYELTEALNVSKLIEMRSDDGEGRLAMKTTIIDGGATPGDATTGVQPIVLASAGASLVGFTIRNGYATDYGGGVRLEGDSTLVSDCFITNCVATNASYNARGGGVALIGKQADVLRTTIVDCKANNGGGVYANGDALSAYGSAVDYRHRIVGCRIVDNEATHKDENATGGGLDTTGGGCWVEDCFFRGNWLTSTSGSGSSNRRGAAMEIQKYTVVTNCVFEKHGSGRRSIIDNGNPCKVTGCVFRGLTSDSENIVGDGNLTDSIVENCVFTNNSAQVLYGSAHLRNCLFAYNTAQLNTRSSVFENCTVVTNSRGFHIEGRGCKPVFINCISAGNGNMTVTNSRGWNNFCFTWQAYTNDVTVSNCCFEGVTKWTNDMSGMPPEVWSMETLDPTGKSFAADPKFVDKANGNFWLKTRSPCLDAALTLDWMTEDAIDLEGNPRRLAKDGKPYPDALPDIGCYECATPAPGLMLLVW